MSNSKVETRTLNCELRAGQSQGEEMALVGRAVTYGAISAPLQNFRERVMPGAFAKSLSSGFNVIADWNHDDKALPLGTTDAKTLTLKDGPDGLDFRLKLDPNQEAHRALYSSVKRGDTKSCSWAFNVDGDDGEDWDTDKDPDTGERFNRRSVKRAKLYGISIVNRPAYPDATSVSARSATAQHALSFEERIFRSTGKYPVVVPTVTDAELRAKAILLGRQIREDSFKACSAVEAIYDENGRCIRFEPTAWNSEAVNKRAQELESERRDLYRQDWAKQVVAASAPLSAADKSELRLAVRSVSTTKKQRCIGGDITATRADHEKAAIAHNVIATRCGDRASAEKHYDAAHQHRLAAQYELPEYQNAAVRSCKESFGEEDDDPEGEQCE